MTGYRDIADDLRAGIIRGEYAPGETIPTLEDLQDRYRVGKETARRAVATLRAEGLVVPIRRRGTVVRDRTPVRMSVSRYTDVLAGHGDLGPWETACARQGLPGRTDLISVTRQEADDTLATQMDVPARTMLVCRLQHMLAGEEVAQIQQTWLPLALAEGTPLAAEGKVVGGIYRMLSRLGHEPAAASEAVTSRMPTREEAETLHLGLGSPVLTVDRATRDHTGAVVVFAQAVLVGDRVQLTYDQVFPRPGEGAR